VIKEADWRELDSEREGTVGDDLVRARESGESREWRREGDRVLTLSGRAHSSSGGGKATKASSLLVFRTGDSGGVSEIEGGTLGDKEMGLAGSRWAFGVSSGE
jgi:hypothetical protein